MTNTPFSQYGETHALQSVIIGRYDGYRHVEGYVEIVNEEQKKGLPTVDQLGEEFEELEQALTSRGVEVLTPDYVGKFVYDQLTPRDIGFTIGNKFVLCHMKKASRRYEAAGIFNILNRISPRQVDVLIPDTYDTLLEGGDVMVDKGMVFIGISQRSNRKGYEFLKKNFQPEFKVVPLQCSSLNKGENVLHLDCTFNPVGKGHALIYPNGFEEIPEVIESKYQWIEVTAAEQKALATNVLSIDEKTVISRKHPACTRVNNAMREAGLEVVEVTFNGAPATGGSFRCCTLPLFRTNKDGKNQA